MTSLIPMLLVVAMLLIFDFSLAFVLYRRERRITRQEHERQ